MKNITSILAITILLLVVLACSFGTKTEETKPQTKSGETKSADTKSETNKSTSSSESTSTGDVAGDYGVNGKSLDGKDYKGDLTVTKRDSVYQFSWSVGGSKYDGVGVKDANYIAVAYSTGENGTGCGAVIYKINEADDSLEGKWGMWGVNEAGTEKATFTEKPSNTFGTLNVAGKNPDGKDYKGKLTVKRDSEDVYQFAWDTGTKYIGTGVKMGDYLAAGSGSKQCGFVIYEVKGGNLEGKWGVPGTTKLGTETASKK